MDLGADVALAIAVAVDADHRWVAALIDCAMRDAVRANGPPVTRPAGALASLARYELAVACGCPWTERVFRKPISRLTVSNDLKFMTRIAAGAASSGDTALLRRLRADGCVWDAATCTAAGAAGALAMLQWARSEGCPWDVGTTARSAAGAGRLEVLQYVCAHGHVLDWDTFAAAARCGDVPVMEWLRLVGCPWGTAVCAAAAASGRLGALQWLRARGCNWDEETCVAAAGHPAVLRWAMSTGCPIDPRTTAAVARTGDLELLQWLHRSGVPLAGGDIMLAAAARGDLAMLRWARERGCDWADDTVHLALAHVDVVRWLLASGCPSRKLTDHELGLAHDRQTCVASAETLQMLRNARMCG